ncbi:MAG: class I SAM-dependent methyltransferase [Bacteroidetes bacterium]|nr:class I SAM-dependent methyltransferase [Bacteroidota bacterium]
MASKNHYDSLAPFYDTVIGKNNSSKKFLLNTAKKYLKTGSKILELGCGTAENLAEFSSKYSLTGIDISEGMLKVACKKIKKAKFVQGDISNFSLEEKFDMIFCVYDTINHLDNFYSWISLFKCVRNHLNEGGIFIFDFNTLYKLNILSQSDIYPEFPGEDTLLLNVKKETKNLFHWEIKYFKHVSAAKYELIKSVIPESGYETTKILSEVKKNFTLLNTYNENFKKAAKNSLRIFCVVKQK